MAEIVFSVQSDMYNTSELVDIYKPNLMLSILSDILSNNFLDNIVNIQFTKPVLFKHSICSDIEKVKWITQWKV